MPAFTEAPRKGYVSVLPTGDESRIHLHEQLSSRRTHLVPIGSLLPADSPRLAGETEEHARILAESEAALPPIVVHRDTMRVVDGMHRLRAAALRGDQHIEVRLVEGTAEDAFVLAVVLNAEHGLPLSRQDRTAAAQRIIESHPHWSDRRIASVTGLSPGVVGALRRQADVPMAELSLRTGRDGRSRPVDLVAGRIAASRVIAESPDASLREIASRAGVALATARDVRNRIRLGQDPVPPKLRTAGSGPEQTGGAQTGAEADQAASGTNEFPEQHRADGHPAGAQEPQPVRPAPPAAAAVTETVLARMRRDPSLRMSQTGRALLHLLAAHLLTDEQRQDLVAGVPAHRAADVAQVARLCADRWLQFATDVEVRRAQGGETASDRGRVPSLSPGA